MIKFEIFSDPICPWCFIGKTCFDRARESFPYQQFEVNWKPFQLNPLMPAKGMDRSDYLHKKFGGRQQAINAYKPIVDTAIQHNIKINFEKIITTPNTLDAHRLIYWSNIEGIQDKIVSALFKAYFLEGRDIGKKDTLIEIGETNGFDSKLIKRLLKANQDKEIVRTLDQEARRNGIQGVPMFIVDNTYAVSGAQKTELWKRVFKEIEQNYKNHA